MPKKINLDQARDAGLAMVLILLLLVFLGGRQYLMLPAILCLVLVMTAPALFSLWARIWLGFSACLGTVMSKLLLTLVFGLVVLPVGLMRRVGGADSMRIKIWKKGKERVFTERNDLMTKKDIEHPY